MAAPRVFISSTYYDLRFVRAELAVLEEELGIEVVRFETGGIPYHTASTLPEACCKEIDNCHILVSIIGGRYGSTVVTDSAPPSWDNSIPQSDHADATAARSVSISRLEVERAIQSGLLLFTFVDSSVMGESRTYNANINRTAEIAWATVDSPHVFEFINYIQSLEGRNPVFEFRTPKDIQDSLRNQLAGLFCDLLLREKLTKYSSHLDQVIRSAERLDKLEARVRERELEAEAKLKEMVLPDHPLFTRCREVLGSCVRVFFKSRAELSEFLELFGYAEVNPQEIRDDKASEVIYFHNREASRERRFIGFPKVLFDSAGSLKPVEAGQWTDDAIWVGSKI